nr:hypothetical protein CFP56_09975 [Quercus suber]
MRAAGIMISTLSCPSLKCPACPGYSVDGCSRHQRSEQYAWCYSLLPLHVLQIARQRPGFVYKILTSAAALLQEVSFAVLLFFLLDAEHLLPSNAFFS